MTTLPMTLSHARPAAWAPLPARPRPPPRVLLRVTARSSANAGSGNGAVREVLLVDPRRAKQLAEEDMGRRRQKEREQRSRDIEAVNGGWAVLGLTAAILGESLTGEGVLGQVTLYLNKISSFLENLELQL